MGQVITLLPLLNQTFIVENENTGFLNAVSSPKALYEKAQSNYELALKKLRTANDLASAAKFNLDEIESYYKPYEAIIGEQSSRKGSGYASCEYNDTGVLNPTFDFVIRQEQYGNNKYYITATPNKSISEIRQGGFPIWSKWLNSWNSRTGGICLSRLTNDNYQYIYQEGGSTGEPRYRTAMLEIAAKWLTDLQNVRGVLKGTYDNLADKVLDAQKSLDKATKERDKALESEKIASKQRIEEKQVDPEYLKAKAEADKIILDAGIKKKRTTTILILGLASIAVIGGYLILKKK